MLTLSKPTSPQKLFDYDGITLYINDNDDNKILLFKIYNLVSQMSGIQTVSKCLVSSEARSKVRTFISQV